MSRKDIKISYDQKSRVLSVEVSKRKSADSDIQDNMVLDYDKEGKIVRISLYDFSFGEFRETKKALKSFAHRSGALVASR